MKLGDSEKNEGTSIPLLWFGSRGNESPSSGALATPRAYGVRRFYHLAS